MSERKYYSIKFQSDAVEQVLHRLDDYDSRKDAVKAVSVELGCSARALSQWVSLTIRNFGIPARPTPAGPTPPEHQRLQQLERENQKLMMDNEVLRKACAIFAQAELNR